METVGLGAARQYQIAQKALSPDFSGAKIGGAQAESAKPSALAQGISEFSQVFEAVDSTTQALSSGTGDPHSVVQALATAEVALEGAVTIRNRVVEAYQELLRMPV